VTFNGISAGTATTWSATSITVNVPNTATTGNVVVTVGGTASNGVSFTVTLLPGTPLPPTGILTLLGMAMLGLWQAGRRMKPRVDV
jgi:hypothetical protein